MPSHAMDDNNDDENSLSQPLSTEQKFQHFIEDYVGFLKIEHNENLKKFKELIVPKTTHSTQVTVALYQENPRNCAAVTLPFESHKNDEEYLVFARHKICLDYGYDAHNEVINNFKLAFVRLPNKDSPYSEEQVRMASVKYQDLYQSTLFAYENCINSLTNLKPDFENVILHALHRLASKSLMKKKTYFPSTYKEKFNEENAKLPAESVHINQMSVSAAHQAFFNLKYLTQLTLPDFKKKFSGYPEKQKRTVIRLLADARHLLTEPSESHPDEAIKVDKIFKNCELIQQSKEITKLANEYEQKQFDKNQKRFPLNDEDIKNIRFVVKLLDVKLEEAFSKSEKSTYKELLTTELKQTPLIKKELSVIPSLSSIDIIKPEENRENFTGLFIKSETEYNPKEEDPFYGMKEVKIFEEKRIEYQIKLKQNVNYNTPVYELSNNQILERLDKYNYAGKVKKIANEVVKLFENTGGKLEQLTKLDVGDRTYRIEHPHKTGKYKDIDLIVKSKGDGDWPWYHRAYFKVDHQNKTIKLAYEGHL